MGFLFSKKNRLIIGRFLAHENQEELSHQLRLLVVKKAIVNDEYQMNSSSQGGGRGGVN